MPLIEIRSGDPNPNPQKSRPQISLKTAVDCRKKEADDAKRLFKLTPLPGVYFEASDSAQSFFFFAPLALFCGHLICRK
jgi:hypothetical protein